ncbi:hypothetical protein B0H19DRAFT_1154544 [Mycena capillaripes]|nr:hypothetical protein B0H19DRAFT_1154544 [Mycena capillaripes]
MPALLSQHLCLLLRSSLLRFKSILCCWHRRNHIFSHSRSQVDLIAHMRSESHFLSNHCPKMVNSPTVGQCPFAHVPCWIILVVRQTGANCLCV